MTVGVQQLPGVSDLLVDGPGVGVCDHDVSESSKHLRLLGLDKHRRMDSCRRQHQLRLDSVRLRLSRRKPSRTLNSDVGDAAAIVTDLHMEAAQHGVQLQAEHAAIFTAFRHCRATNTPHAVGQ